MRPLSSEIWPEIWNLFSRSAYTIDDGKGGKIHVNVSIFFFFSILKLGHSRHFKGQFVSCVHHIDRSDFNISH